MGESIRQKLPFEQVSSQISEQIDHHRASWKLTAVAWEDCRQEILTRAWFKYDLFDPAKGELSHWLSPLIINSLRNLYRDHHAIYSRPCIRGCPWNLGNDNCEKTSTGKQCAECPAFKEWQERKLDHFNVKQTLPLENHEQEVNSIQGDFVDYDGAKSVIDREMKVRLTKQEWKIYKMLYIQGKDEKEVQKTLGKTKSKHKMGANYLKLLQMRNSFKELARKIIEEKNLA